MSDLFISKEQAEGDLLAAAAFIGERIKSSDGHAEAMNAVLPLYLEKGEVDLAAELANAVDDPFSRDKLLTLVAEKCAAVDDVEYALQLAESIEDLGIQSQAMERIALICAGKGDIEKASEIANSMAHPDFVYAGIAVNQAASGDESAAKATLSTIGFASAEVSAQMQIASILIQSGRVEAATEWLDAAADSAVDIEHDEERIRAFCDIGNHFVDAKRSDKAVTTFDMARGYAEQIDNTHRDLFLGTCALGFLYAGSTDLADRTLDLVTDKTQMSSALLGFARHFWKKDEKEEALDTLEEAYAILKSQRDTETRDSRTRNRLLMTIGAQFAGFGKTERATEVAHENPDPAEETAALSQISQILIMQHEDDLARQTVGEIEEDSNRLFALIGLADAKLELGEADAAVGLISEAATMADSIPQIATRSSVLNEIAVRFARHGNADDAKALCVENLAAIADIKDASSQAVLLANISSVSDAFDLDLIASSREKVGKMIGSYL